MSTTIAASRGTSASGPAPAVARPPRLDAVNVLLLSASCGLAGGLLEVAARIVCRWIDPTKRLYGLSRHFVWLAPLSMLLLFAGVGLLLALATKAWPRRGGWLATRFVCFWAVLPALIVAGPRIYPAAWAIVALGNASLAGGALERHAAGLRRRLLRSFPALAGSVLILAAVVFGGDWLKERLEVRRPLPPAGTPNVLLVVMDTVRADRLSLYGYARPTTPALERLARRGIRFDEARATAPWTLASHASLFSGRWPHELGVQWLTPLPRNFPTLAGYLGSHGYATAGFVANKLYCSYETRLDRGFTHYEDYVLEKLMPLRTAWLVDHFLDMVTDLGSFAGRTLDIGPFPPTMRDSWVASLFFVVNPRKNAEAVDRAFLDWLAHRPEPARPFFAFLNFFDAHAPYVLPGRAPYRFGLKPRNSSDLRFLVDYWQAGDKLNIRPAYQALARDCYDNCVAYLDEQLGKLFDELARRGVLDRTLVIVASDHGEGLGDHGLFDHGESLYRSEIRVPLLIVPHGRAPAQRIVADTVSLRDLPATIVDMVGLGSGAPFPGRSLAPLWRGSSTRAGPGAEDIAISELASPNPFNPNQGRSPAYRGPLFSLAQGDFVYIRNLGDGTEALFNERDDPGELRNQARVEAVQPVLERFRRHLDSLKAKSRMGGARSTANRLE